MFDPSNKSPLIVENFTPAHRSTRPGVPGAAGWTRGHNPGMAYDEELAERIRELVAGEQGVTEQRMFGGLGFLIDGNMSVAASRGGGLLVRIDPDQGDALIDDKLVAPMMMGGRPMSGWLHVADTAVAEDDQLREWVDRGVSFARALPAKTAKTAKKKAKR